MPRIIDKFKCIACGTCERVCKVGCITQLENKKRIIGLMSIFWTQKVKLFLCFTSSH